MAGHNLVKMAELSELYNELGFTDVQTYIQSGNVIFSNSNSRSASALSSEIERGILKKFNLVIPVMIRSLAELKELLITNPFLNEDNFDSKKMAVAFLHEEASDIQIQKVITVNYPPDKFKISGKEIFIYCPNGFGRTKFYTNFFEKKMGVTGTARNWNSVTTILNILEKGI